MSRKWNCSVTLRWGEITTLWQTLVCFRVWWVLVELQMPKTSRTKPVLSFIMALVNISRWYVVVLLDTAESLLSTPGNSSSSDDRTLSVPVTMTTTLSPGFSYCALKQEDSLHSHIRRLPTIKSINHALKTHLFHEHYSQHQPTAVSSCDCSQLTSPSARLCLQIYDPHHPYCLFPDSFFCLLYVLKITYLHIFSFLSNVFCPHLLLLLSAKSMLLREGDHHFRWSLRLMRVVHSLPYLLQQSTESGSHSTAGLFVKKEGRGLCDTRLSNRMRPSLDDYEGSKGLHR